MLKMKSAAKHPNENQRLKSLEALNILDTLPESDFDQITQLASEICGTPIALISLVDKDRQWFKSKVGLNVDQTHRDVALCAHAILQPDVFVVEDLSKDERFADNPLSAGAPNIQFYAGAPLLSPDGYPIGTVCVIDTKTRSFSPGQVSALKTLSNQITRLLDLRTKITTLEESDLALRVRDVAIESISEGVIIRDISGKVIDVNSAALRILNINHEKVFEITANDITWNAVTEDGVPLDSYEHPSEVVLRTGRSAKKTVVGITNQDGVITWLQVSAEPIFKNKLSELFGVAMSFSDITSQIEDKKRIEKNQIELRFILDSVPHMIGYWSSELVNINSNEIYSKYFGKKPQEIRGLHIREVLGEEVFLNNRPYLEQALEGRTVNFERALNHSDGTLRQTLATYVPNFEEGKVTSILAIIIDITELKALEQQRQKLESQLVESSRLSALGEMAGGVAHEINTPLAIVRAKAEMLKERMIYNKLDLETAINDFGIIEVTVDRIAKIVKGLLAYSRNAENDSLENCSVRSIINDSLELCMEKLKIGSVKVEVYCDSNIHISCRSAQISQVLMNLIINANDATAELNNKWIKIKAIEDQDNVEITVSDSGQGIPPAVVSKMMQPFFSTKEVGKGTGLGLSISMGIVEAHGGKLKYLSDEKNTTFCISLPRSKNHSIKTVNN